MKATARHDCGMHRTVELLDVVDAEAGEAYIRWPLGDVYAVNVATGRLSPTPEQSPVIDHWQLIGNGLRRARALLQARRRELSIPVAEHPEQLQPERAKYIT